MARRAARIDKNQPKIVKALRNYGATVTSLASVGDGVPDLLVGFRGDNYLLEVKNGEDAKLTPAQVVWHRDWKGRVHVVRTVQEALDVLWNP